MNITTTNCDVAIDGGLFTHFEGWYLELISGSAPGSVVNFTRGESGQNERVVSPGPLSVGEHVVWATYDGVSMYIYIDGALAGTAPSTLTTRAYAYGLAVRNYFDPVTLDDPLILLRAVTAAEVAADYQAATVWDGKSPRTFDVRVKPTTVHAGTVFAREDATGLDWSLETTAAGAKQIRYQGDAGPVTLNGGAYTAASLNILRVKDDRTQVLLESPPSTVLGSSYTRPASTTAGFETYVGRNAKTDGLKVLNGAVDEARVSNIVRTDAGAAPYTNDANTLALYHFDTSSNVAYASSGEFLLTAAPGQTARIQSIVKAKYRPGRELYLVVPARFVELLSSGVHLRVGLFDDGDGFFFGEQNEQFGFTVRKAGFDSFVALTDANGDPLDASFRSRFARGARLEVYDPTNKNVWRVRVGLLGSSVQFFDLQSPDGVWMRVHSNRFANLQKEPSIRNWVLPFRAEIVHGGASGTAQIGIGSVDGGFVGDPYGLEASNTNGNEHSHIALLGLTTAGLKHTNIAGRREIVKSASVSGENTSTTTAARIRFRDGSVTGKCFFTMAIEEATGGLGGINTVGNEDQSYPEGVQLDDGIYLEIVSGSPNIDYVSTGYHEAKT